MTDRVARNTDNNNNTKTSCIESDVCSSPQLDLAMSLPQAFGGKTAYTLCPTITPEEKRHLLVAGIDCRLSMQQSAPASLIWRAIKAYVESDS